jgi:phage tail-like protein
LHLRAPLWFAQIFLDEVREMPVNTDPLEDFSFVVNWGGTRIGMTRVSPLRWSTSVVSHRDGSNATNSPQKAPGLTGYDPITLEREIYRGDLDFQSWASEVVGAGGGGSGYRRDVTITLLDGQHNVLVAFTLKNCWPSAYEAVSELNADTSHVAIERLTLEYDSFLRSDD